MSALLESQAECGFFSTNISIHADGECRGLGRIPGHHRRGLNDGATPSTFDIGMLRDVSRDEVLALARVDAVIGASCSSACEPVAFLTAARGIPQISNGCSADSLSDDSKYSPNAAHGFFFKLIARRGWRREEWLWFGVVIANEASTCRISSFARPVFALFTDNYLRGDRQRPAPQDRLQLQKDYHCTLLCAHAHTSER